MRVFDVGGSVFYLRFFPDGRRLLVGTQVDKAVTLAVHATDGDDRLVLPLPPLQLDDWWHSGYGHAAAVHPSGEWLYVAWEKLYSFRAADGSARAVPDVSANQVIVSPAGDRVVAARCYFWGPRELTALAADAGGDRVLWRNGDLGSLLHAAGFLPGGDQFVTLEDVARVRDFAAGGEVRASRAYASRTAHYAQVSADGRYFAVAGYTSMYVYDVATLGKPRLISGSSASGDFAAIAFHPAGRTMAVIHGGPTLVKLYDLETLRPTRKLAWKLGPLGAVAFSPDGTLGAAGSHKGQVVVWDADP